jgi:hypothetical protein
MLKGRFFVFLVLAALLLPAAAGAQEYSEQTVDGIWRQVCELNREAFPDSNLVFPGDSLLLPDGSYYYVTGSSGEDHMWRASRFYYEKLLYVGEVDTATGTGVPEDKSIPWKWLLPVLLVFLTLARYFIIRSQ